MPPQSTFMPSQAMGSSTGYCHWCRRWSSLYIPDGIGLGLCPDCLEAACAGSQGPQLSWPRRRPPGPIGSKRPTASDEPQSDGGRNGKGYEPQRAGKGKETGKRQCDTARGKDGDGNAAQEPVVAGGTFGAAPAPVAEAPPQAVAADGGYEPQENVAGLTGMLEEGHAPLSSPMSPLETGIAASLAEALPQAVAGDDGYEPQGAVSPAQEPEAEVPPLAAAHDGYEPHDDQPFASIQERWADGV